MVIITVITRTKRYVETHYNINSGVQVGYTCVKMARYKGHAFMAVSWPHITTALQRLHPYLVLPLQGYSFSPYFGYWWEPAPYHKMLGASY
jgi:hypothetical protein